MPSVFPNDFTVTGANAPLQDHRPDPGRARAPAADGRLSGQFEQGLRQLLLLPPGAAHMEGLCQGPQFRSGKQFKHLRELLQLGF